MRARPFLALLAGLAAAIFSHPALAHPMGNFSVNHYAKVELGNDRVLVHYILDLAEIPAFQEMQNGNIEATADSPEVIQYVAARGAELGRGLVVEIGGKRLPLEMTSRSVIFPPGAGGLPTMKVGFVFEAALPANADRSHLSLRYADNNFEGHAGWKEIIAVATTGSLLRSSVPSTDRSAELSNYPTDLLNSPPQDLEASIEFALPAAPTAVRSAAQMSAAASLGALQHAGSARPVISAWQRTGPSTGLNRTRAAMRAAPHELPASIASSSKLAPVALSANRQQTPRSKFTELITAQNLSLWFLFTAAVLAFGLGALHALEPGHGKTIVAAYLVGSRGTARHAFLLGLIVTASHTAGVFALGAITIFASRYIVPEQLYPWLGVLSGITIAGLGFYMFLRRITGTATDHSHGTTGSHGNWPFSSRVNVEGRTEERADSSAPRQVGLGQLFTLGITGGIIPCPAALVVLLSAFALHRIALGFFLIVAFSCGLSAVLIAFGMVMVYAGRLVARLRVDGPLTRRWLPAASSAFIAVLGLALAIQATASMHFTLPRLSPDRIGPFLFVIGLGLVLGMRHSTDADHVVAISTIVSKQRSIRGAALIGSVWGLGHTITVFAVGALIILFGVEIPPRIGLSMEFSVAVMLVLLGVLNLTGVMRRITARLTPGPAFAKAPGQIRTETNGDAKPNWIAQSAASLGAFQMIRPLAIGLVHGLAGSAAVALLVLSTIHDPVWATAYLLIFGAGTLVGMTLMTAAISVPLAVAGKRSARLSHYFGVASGMVSLCFGSFLVYQLGFLGGLFTGHPQWTPQ